MIAIYTPTYNRSKELSRLYESLCKQENKDFFWLIIDDGSTDNTREKIEMWIAENILDIQYIYKENGGKHTAINVALDIVDEYWNFCVDSDDWLIDENVLDNIVNDISRVENDNTVVSLVYPRKFNNLEIKNILFDPILIEDCDLRNRKINVFETIIVSRPHSYSNIRFPIFENETFISENAIEIPKAFNSKQLYFNYPIVEGKYLNDGLSKNIIKIWKENPIGYYYVRNLQVNYYKSRNKYLKCLIPLGQIVGYNIETKKNLLSGVHDLFWGILSIPLGLGYWWKKFR